MCSGLFSMFGYEDDPVFQFMLYEFVTEHDEDASDDESEAWDITLSLELTHDPEADADVGSLLHLCDLSCEITSQISLTEKKDMPCLAKK